MRKPRPNFYFGGVRMPSRTFTFAEGVGFEPTGHLCPLVFKTRSIGRSDNPPDRPSLPSRARLNAPWALDRNVCARAAPGRTGTRATGTAPAHHPARHSPPFTAL